MLKDYYMVQMFKYLFPASVIVCPCMYVCAHVYNEAHISKMYNCLRLYLCKPPTRWRCRIITVGQKDSL